MSSQIKFQILPFEYMMLYNIQYKIIKPDRIVTEHCFLITIIKQSEKQILYIENKITYEKA